jgi:hypothetical protein
VAAAVLVTLVVAAVLVFGVVRPPPLDDLDPAPGDVPGIAWMRFDDEPCLVVLQAGAEPTTPWCTSQGGEVVAWTDDGVVVRTWAEGQDETLTTVDPDDGTVVDTAPAPFGGPPGSDVTTSRSADDVLEVRAGDQLLWRVEASSAYEITQGWLNPDGDVVALQDSGGRLLVVPADGSSPPRVWAEDVEPWTWLVWEGTTLA